MCIPVVLRMTAPPSADISWLLYATEAWMRGGRLGREILEVSPPMVFWLKAPVVWAAIHFHVDATYLWYLATGVLGCAAATYAGRTVVSIEGAPPRWAAYTTLLFAGLFLLVPGVDYGQKDHVAILLLVPYILVASMRVVGRSVTTPLAVGVGVFAALGMGIKPHFMVAILAVPAFELAHMKKGRTVCLPENIFAWGLAGVYLALVLLLAPEYARFASEYGALYVQYLPLWSFPGNLSAQAIPALVVITGYSLSRSVLAASNRRYLDLLATTTLAFNLGALTQAKGWSYHFVPANTLAVLLIVSVALHATGRPPRFRFYLPWPALASGSVFAIMATWSLFANVVATRVGTVGSQVQMEANDLRSIVVPGEPIALLSTAVESSFPLIPSTGTRWVLRFPHLWPLAVFNADRIKKTTPINRPHEDVDPREVRFLRALCEDLARTKPRVILVETYREPRGDISVASRFDYVAYLSQSPPLADVLGQYQRYGRTGSLDVLVRARSVGAEVRCGEP